MSGSMYRYHALARSLYLLALPLLRIKKTTSTLLIVDKVIEKQLSGRYFVTRDEYYVTPEGWSNSLEVTAEQYQLIQVGDIIEATWTPHSKEIVRFSKVEQVSSDYPLVISTPDYQYLDLLNLHKGTKYFLLVALPIALFYWIIFLFPNENLVADPVSIKSPLVATGVVLFLGYRFISVSKKLRKSDES